MGVKLRLRRMGKKKQPIYKIVAADVRSPRDGKFLEAVGIYNPLIEPHSVNIKEERVLYWLENGAQATKTVKSLLRQQGITLKNELTKRGVTEDIIESELSEWKKKKEASASAKGKKKKVSRKSKAKAESAKETVEVEKVSAENSESNEETVSDESTAEVKGATSDEKETETEKETDKE